MNRLNSILLVGLGDIGEHILELLTRVPSVSQIYAVDKSEELKSKVYSAVASAIHQGYSPRVEFSKLDLNNIDATAELLKRIDPDIIISSAALKTWWVAQAALPKDTFVKLDEAGYGPWLPFHLTLIHKLMMAVKKSGMKRPVVNCSYPDAVNAILGKLDMAPTVGLGNCDLFLPRLRKIVADRLNVPLNEVTIYFVGHHFLCHVLAAYRSTCNCPYYLKLVVDNKDVTKQFDTDRLLIESNENMPKGMNDHFIVAASAVKNTLGILQDTKILTYVPGPEGLPGGYPTRLSKEGARVELPSEITRREAVRINEESQKLDGIERIEDDGRVVFTSKAHAIMNELLGYDCRSLRPDESEGKARELLRAFEAFSAKTRQ
jgi:hypothetical protein